MAIYLVSSPYIGNGEIYKIGKTTLSIPKLKQRYTTYFGKPRIVFYKRCGIKDYSRYERNALNALSNYRIKTNKKRRTELIKGLRLNNIIKILNECCVSTEKELNK